MTNSCYFNSDRVLKTLLYKETQYLPLSKDYFSCRIQTEIEPFMRKQVADWMLDICDHRETQIGVFCLAINYLDRFLSVCTISRSQLQLLAAVCLLVAWKVKENSHLPATCLVEYSDLNINLMDITDWEMLLLSKLDWDVSSVIACDFLDHIFQRINPYIPVYKHEDTRRQSEILITICSLHYPLSSAFSPSLIAAACVITSIKPYLEPSSLIERFETNSPSNTSSQIVKPTGSMLRLSTVLETFETVMMLDIDMLQECSDVIEGMLRHLPPTPESSPDSAAHFKNVEEEEEREDTELNSVTPETPTKVLEVATVTKF